MLLSGHAHTVAPGEGRTANLGVAQMRVLAAGEAIASQAFPLAEFTGGPGPWTVPHIHREMEKSFYVLDGEFTFTVGEQEIPAGPGSYLLVPRGTRHGIIAGAEGGRFLTLMVPDGLDARLLPGGRPRRGISVVAVLSQWLVHSNGRRDGAWTQGYEHGIPATGLQRRPGRIHQPRVHRSDRSISTDWTPPPMVPFWSEFL